MENHLNIERIEARLLVEGIYQKYGYDFSGYSESSRLRRIRNAVSTLKMNNIPEMMHSILLERDHFRKFLSEFTVTTSEMFRDPDFFQSLKTNVFPILRTYPSFRVWHAGCSTGDEVFSFAILLKEAGLLEKATIFSTDINPSALESAKQGIFPRDRIGTFASNYLAAGGENSLSDYFTVDRNFAVLNSDIMKKVYFYEHNLVSDGIFSQFEIIFCRNVLIYFDKNLQNKVIYKLTRSLNSGGVLALGNQESLEFTKFKKFFSEIDQKCRIFRFQS